MKTKQSHVYRKRKVAAVVIRTSLVVVGVVLFVWFIHFISALSWFKIEKVEVFVGDQALSQNIHDRVQAMLDGSYLGIISKSNIFIYPKASIEEIVRLSSSAIDTVNITRDGMHTLRISTSDKVARAIVCLSLPDVHDNVVTFNPAQGDCYFTDQDGYAFAEATDSIRTKVVLYMQDGIATSTTKDSSVMPSEKFGYILNMYNALSEAGIPVDGLLIHENDEYEVFAGSTTIYVNENHGLSVQIENVIAFWKHMKKSFDYIDARYGSNIFYKILE